MPTKIKIMCPKCRRILTIEIATIDKLRAENQILRQELARYERPDDDSAVDMLKNMFGMKD